MEPARDAGAALGELGEGRGDLARLVAAVVADAERGPGVVARVFVEPVDGPVEARQPRPAELRHGGVVVRAAAQEEFARMGESLGGIHGSSASGRAQTRAGLVGAQATLRRL